MARGGPWASVVGYVVAALLALAGTAVGGVMVVAGVFRYVDQVEDFQRVPIGTPGTVTLRGTGGYTVYYEAIGADEGPRPTLPVRITDEEGAQLSVEPYDSEVTYDISGYEGVAVGSFGVDRPGTFQVLASDTVRTGTLAVGRGFGGTVVSPVLLGCAVILLGLLLGSALATVTLLGRSRAERSRRAASRPWQGL